MKTKITIITKFRIFVTSTVMGRRKWQPTPVFLPGESRGWRSLVGCSPCGCWESDTTERLYFHFSLSRIGEGNDNPLQYSCLEDPRGRGAWWAAVYGVAVRLKRLSNSASWVSQVVLVNNLSANANETCGFSPCAGKIPWRRKWQPTSSLENPMDRGAWWANSPQGHKIYQLSPTQL